MPEGAFFDLSPVSVITTSTLEQLEWLAPVSRFDSRRFRMNATVATDGPGFVESGWVGRQLVVGDGVYPRWVFCNGGGQTRLRDRRLDSP